MRSRFLLCIAVACGVSAFGQGDHFDATRNPASLMQRGHYQEAVPPLLAFVKSNSLDDLQRARAEILLGLAYKELGQQTEAEQSYEQALAMLRRDQSHIADYANTLDLLGSLKSSTGDWKGAMQLLQRAAQIDRQLQDHSSLAAVELHLVGANIQRGHRKEARKFLEAAKAEIERAGPRGTDLLADVYGSEGWLASTNGDNALAFSSYAKALVLCKQQFGSAHPLTGWSYLLVGKAGALNGDLLGGLANMRLGLDILKQSEGPQTMRYLTGELAYSSMLDRAGMHSEAQKLSAEANSSMASIRRQPCSGCTVSVWGLRNR